MRLAAALILLGLSSCAWGQPPYERVKGATISLGVPGGSCSATAVSRHVMLTASHCLDFKGALTVITANGTQCEVSKAVNDGADHMLLYVKDCVFTVTAKLGKPGKVSDPVFCWGSPMDFDHLLRFGTLAGYHKKATVFDITGWKGDSGAAIFNAKGRIIGVVSWGRPPLRIMVSEPFQFTFAQWKEAGL